MWEYFPRLTLFLSISLICSKWTTQSTIYEVRHIVLLIWVVRSREGDRCTYWPISRNITLPHKSNDIYSRIPLLRLCGSTPQSTHQRPFLPEVMCPLLGPVFALQAKLQIKVPENAGHNQTVFLLCHIAAGA